MQIEISLQRKLVSNYTQLVSRVILSILSDVGHMHLPYLTLYYSNNALLLVGRVSNMICNVKYRLLSAIAVNMVWN